MNLVKKLLFLRLTIVHQYMLMIQRKISLILVEDPTNESEDTSITAEVEYSINVTEIKKGNFCEPVLQ